MSDNEQDGLETSPQEGSSHSLLSKTLILTTPIYVLLLALLAYVPYRAWMNRWDPNPAEGVAQREKAAEEPALSSPDPKPQRPAQPPHDPNDGTTVSAEEVRVKLESIQKRVDQMDDQEKLETLDRVGNRLEQISSQESVTQMAGQMKEWLGTSKRASRPAEEPVEGEFDTSTGQIHELRRSKTDRGEEYVAVLLDAQGRTLETPISQDVGRRLYPVFETIRKYPLLEGVYREVVMGLLDEVLKERKAPSKKQPK